jgi:hypothetical protein
MPQSGVSKIEQRSNVTLDTLTRYVAATGGTLHLITEFPEARIEIPTITA